MGSWIYKGTQRVGREAPEKAFENVVLDDEINL